ncbi:HTH_48 domain-containing protein [Trichonephila clavipes]|nr:HTH_48 domain-containing protein [Trichonephila clavipes]
MLGRRIAARPRPPATVRDLEIALLEEWNSIPQSLIDNLIVSMANKRGYFDLMPVDNAVAGCLDIFSWTPLSERIPCPYEDKMAFALQNSTIEEQRSVIRFLTAEGEKPAAIYQWMVTVYGEKCLSEKSVRKLSARCRARRESVGDDQRPVQANTVIMIRSH